MDLIDFLKTPTATLPKDRPSGSDFPEYLRSIFESFIAELRTVSGTDQLTLEVSKNIPVIQSLADMILESVRKYYEGLPHDAFVIMRNWILANASQFGALYSVPIPASYLSRLYRIRVPDSGDFTRQQMFHIPFQDRHKVKTQRYSIPGYPSLYTGSSLYICWKELGCPQFDSVYSVRLEAKANIRVLDFGYIPSELSKTVLLQIQSGTQNQQLLKVLLPKIIFWPLIAACSIRTLYPKAPFKPEYIMPQLLLQYVKEDLQQGIDGIRYFSTHYDQLDYSLTLGCNFVFPVKSFAPRGQCPHLINLFNMTEVLPWQIANHISMPSIGAPSVPIELVRGCACDYINTIFGDMEGKSMPMIASAL